MLDSPFPDRQRKLATIALIALILPQTHAANMSWSPTAPADSNWHTATNWTGGIVPGSADQVQANSGSSVISAASTIKYLALDSNFQLTLNGTAANLTVNAGTGVNYGLYMNSATLKIQNGATLTTSIGSASSSSSKSVFLGNSGTATVEVSGTGSTATFNQRVALGGGAGQGTTLTIRDGGTVNASSTAIAGINGQASVLVDGGTFNAGTSATVGSFNIGNYGAGTLTIRNNGVVTNGLSAATVGGATATGTPTLGGIGTINGPAVIAAATGGTAGTLAPGIPGINNSVGTLTLNNTVSYGSGSIFEWNLQAVATTDPGAVADASTGTYDKVVLNGGANSVTGDSSVFNIVLGGNTFSDPFWNTNKRWTDLFTGTGTPSDLSAIFTTFAGSGNCWRKHSILKSFKRSAPRRPICTTRRTTASRSSSSSPARPFRNAASSI